jgi:N-acetyl-anhydromuramyl-L-alanine amidase AmpD
MLSLLHRNFCVYVASAILVWLHSTPVKAQQPASEKKPIRFVERWLPAKVSKSRPPDAVVDTIMLHFCSVVATEPDNPYQIDRIIDVFTSYTVSAHYLIDRDGTVYRFVPERKQAYHAGRGELPFGPKRKNALNAGSIGIEMFAIGSAGDMKLFMKEDAYAEFARKHPKLIGFTPEQYRALNYLIDDIISRHPHIKRDRFHIVGHEEYAGRTRRTDPGELFDWKKIGLTRDRPTTATR